MDWFLYDNGLRHERVKLRKEKPILIFHLLLTQFSISVKHLNSRHLLDRAYRVYISLYMYMNAIISNHKMSSASIVLI